MKVALCVIARNENPYINEWCHHYLNIGFSHIYLYDNNLDTDPFIGDCIDKELLDKITILNWHSRHELNLALHAYEDCYNNYDYDWFAFLDVDEFLVGVTDICEFLSQEKFKNIEQIKLPCELFGDDEMIDRDITQPVFGAFKIALTDTHHKICKSIIRGKITGFRMPCPHYGSKLQRMPLNTCYPSGLNCTNEALSYYVSLKHIQDTETVWLNHYQTKTIAEFMRQKYMLPDVVRQHINRRLDYFWHYNRRTPEKEAYIQKYLQTLYNK